MYSFLLCRQCKKTDGGKHWITLLYIGKSLIIVMIQISFDAGEYEFKNIKIKKFT